MEGNWRDRSKHQYSAGSNSVDGFRSIRDARNRSGRNENRRTGKPRHIQKQERSMKETELPGIYRSRQPRTRDEFVGKSGFAKVVETHNNGCIVSFDKFSDAKNAEPSKERSIYFAFLNFAQPPVGEEVEFTITRVQGPNIEVIWKPPPVSIHPEKMPLVILDLNGVLLDRTTFALRQNSNQRKYYIRPYCAEFLRFCFQNFQVAVWSCGKKQNMEMEIFNGYEDRLKFVFDQEMSSNMWPEHSEVSRDKPLFLKQLTTVFSRFPEFHEGNTILVDNHLEKFRGNPENTCCIVPEYTHSNPCHDDVLAPNGLLVQQLTGICAQYPQISTSTTISKLNSPYFPKSYVIQHQKPQLFEKIQNSEQYILRRRFAEVFTSSEFMKRNCPERDVQFYLRHRDIPGPRAIPLRRAHLSTIKESDAKSFVVCEKSDGVRMMLFIDKSKSGSERPCFLVNRKWEFHYGGDILADNHPLQCFKDSPSFTMLDGELISGKAQKGYLVFDIVWLNGIDVGREKSLLGRIESWKSHMLQKSSNSSTLFVILTKEFAFLDQISAVSANIYEKSFPELGKIESDGLVLTPTHKEYYDYQVYKFKPLELLTIDFYISNRSLYDIKRPGHVDVEVLSYSKFKSKKKPELIPLGKCYLSSDQKVLIEMNMKQMRENHAIIECAFDRLNGRWYMNKLRHDKDKPNSLQGAWNVLESIAESMTIEDLLNLFPSNNGALAVARHYNERQNSRNKRMELNSEIFMLRKLNGLAKSLLISGSITSNGFDALKSEDLTKILMLSSIPKVFLETRPPTSHSGVNRRSKRKKFSVLDLACGRGGDLLKWQATGELHEYIGCDIADVALTEAKRRAASLKNGHLFKFHLCDMASPTLQQTLAFKDHTFDFVSIQFAFHYCCDTELRCEQLLKNVAKALQPGGKLLVSTMDPRILLKLLSPSRKYSEQHDLFSVKLEVSLDDLGEKINQFGIAYKISVGDAVQDCTEFLVPLEKVRAIAKSFGLQLIYFANLCNWLALNSEEYGDDLREMMTSMRLLPVPRRLSNSEWEAMRLYCILIFEKETTSNSSRN